MKLDSRQRSRVVNLLSRLSPDTVDNILSRFDADTVFRIRRDLETPRQPDSGQGVVTEFAEFLNFPPLAPESGPSRGDCIQPRSGRGSAATCRVTVDTIMNLSDESIDDLLAAISPALTVQMLCCSRESFIHRVLSRMNPHQATQVVQQINDSEAPGFARMKAVQHRYCQIVSDLAAQGLIELVPASVDRPCPVPRN